MFLAQLAVAMLVWAAVIVLLTRRREELMSSMASKPRGRRTIQAVARLIGSIAVLGLGMLILTKGGLTSQGFTIWGWMSIVIAGSAFIYLQTTALVPLVLNAVTPSLDKTSDRKDADHS